MDYSEYERLLFERRANGVLLITINRPEKYNAADERMKDELTQVWLDVNRDAQTRVAVITGAGKAFCAGGDIDKEQRVAGAYRRIASTLEGGRDLVLNMLNCDKTIISAINGVAVGAGLATALMADISVIGEDVRFTDGHMRIGVVAGDHAAMIWPLLCGMAKAKYYLLTADFIDGREAERIGLVSKCVPLSDVVPQALAIADKIGRNSPDAVKWTKRALNNWLHQARPVFESSLAHEMLTFFSEDMLEGVTSVAEKRPPSFPSLQES
jgi:enoyl-CoA hydratase/carnithine racemase